MTKEKLTFEDYVKMGKNLKEVRNSIFCIEYKTPKSCFFNRRLVKAIKSIDVLRSELEELMFSEYPNQSTTKIFYGPIESGDKTR